ncbi:hypothetical protein AAE478_006824 [Parahypoxylon ruwenzoriense]
MPYLTYIIDRYDNLPNVVIFLHAERFQWHNDNPDFDGLQMLQNLRLSYVQEVGYANLRCAWAVGCPAEIRPAVDEKSTWEGDIMAKYVYAQAWRELFPDRRLPEVVGASCCEQFAVTRELIHQHSRKDYERWRQWLIDTPLDYRTSGTVLEYLWHRMSWTVLQQASVIAIFMDCVTLIARAKGAAPTDIGYRRSVHYREAGH